MPNPNHYCSKIPVVYVRRTAIGYVAFYRPLSLFIVFVLLDVRFNDRWHTFTPSAAKGGQVAPMQSEGM